MSCGWVGVLTTFVLFKIFSNCSTTLQLVDTMKVNLKEMTRHIVADKLFGKVIENYGEKSSRNVLDVKECIVSANIARKLERKTDLVGSLQELFERMMIIKTSLS